MNISQVHLALWESKRRPSWARDMKMPVRPDIDACINAHAGAPMPPRESLDVENMVVLCRRHVGAGDLGTFLLRLFWEPGTVVRPKRRQAIARRWFNRIARQEGWEPIPDLLATPAWAKLFLCPKCEGGKAGRPARGRSNDRRCLKCGHEFYVPGF
jgi:hypothetical protein